jgi:hypothetical protein
VIDLKPKTILDLGFGFGSKGMLFREYTDVWNGDYFGWKTRIDGVEIYDEYITDLQRIIYDNIYTQNISLFVKTMGYYDLVYMGDVIEHFSKEEGKKVIEELKKKSRCLIIVTPVKVLAQGDVYGNKFEEHKSQWSAEDFEGFEIETFRNVMVAVYLRPGIFYCPGMEFYGVRARVYFKFTSYQIDRPCFFMGLYFDRDYEVFKNHKGERYVFWNGSDVKRLLKNPEWQEIVTKYPAKHACHNKQLKEELKSVGVSALIRPIFFGDMDNFNVSYIPSKPTKLYINIRKGREGEYGLYKLLRVAKQVLDVEFHIYGISGESQENVFYHGLVEETYMDREIKQYQGVLRLNEHDGLSQMVIKAGLLGQYIVSSNDVKGAIKAVSDDEIVEAIKEIQKRENPNLEFREYFFNRLNNFDWL